MRRLVPALGVIALASPAAMSQEIAKGLFLDGFSDNVFSYSAGAPADDKTVVGKQRTNDSASFTSAAVLHVGWKLNDQVAGKINLHASTLDSTQTVFLRESFVSLTPGKSLNVTFGKFISHIGWQAAESTGLYRINVAPGTVTIYGAPSVEGASVGWSNEQVSVSVLATNGFFGSTDGSNNGNANAGAKDNALHTLGFGANLTYQLPNKLGSVDLEWAYDATSATSAITHKTGAINQFGINTTLKPTDKLLLAGEGIYRTTSAAVQNKNGKRTSQNDLFALFLANHVLPTDDVLFPSSATVSVSRYAPGYDEKHVPANTNQTAASNEVAVAWLTNPFNTTNFGLNLEVAQTTYDQKHAGQADDDAIRIALEGLVIIP